MFMHLSVVMHLSVFICLSVLLSGRRQDPQYKWCQYRGYESWTGGQLAQVIQWFHHPPSHTRYLFLIYSDIGKTCSPIELLFPSIYHCSVCILWMSKNARKYYWIKKIIYSEICLMQTSSDPWYFWVKIGRPL